MKNIYFILFLFYSVISYAECPTQTVCRSGTCYEEVIPTCGNNNVNVISPNHTEIDYQNWYKKESDQLSNNESLNNTLKSQPSTTYTPPSTSYTPPSCAENGSCYGDISNINGLPKTTNVRGYYRKDGTYVRGHYRSKGRR